MEIWILVLSLFSIVGMLLCLAFFPEIHLGKHSFQTFWIPPFIVAVILLATGLESGGLFWSFLTSTSSINPLEILVLFLSMAFLSTVLDESGFFAFVATKTVSLAKGSQFTVFALLYLLTSFLTIFTSNDIIILTFTPFLIYFSKQAKVDPIPYLVGEFVAANTWSLLFLIGNPTNIYLGTSFSITFAQYFLSMWPSTLLAGGVSFGIMALLFYKKLSQPFAAQTTISPIKSPVLMAVSLSILSLCIVLMALSSFWDLSLWIISGVSALVLLFFCGVYLLYKKKDAPMVFSSIKRLPYTVIPFVLSMFAIVMALKGSGLINGFASWLSGGDPIWSYGISSFLFCDFINNIPMSVLFTEVIRAGGSGATAVYASIIGSNIGAFLTPIGALAGVMWMSILKNHGIRFTFLDFAKYGVLIAVPTMAAALLGLYL